jgi:succinate-semialdehyde dehydrogenase/glutarate-semialdehyde dehydrogenase
MELGGNAPFLVFPDCDLEAAIDGAMKSKFRNSGQTCVCANRFLVHADVYEAFSAGLKAAVAKLKVGCGTSGADIGPLINLAAIEKCERHISDAVAKGAVVGVGGGRHPKGGSFFIPTVLEGCTAEMAIFSEETFGPVITMLRKK